MTMHIDCHVIQTVPPSNLNRDDTGSPKTALFGGVRRARVSSQAWKRATRRDFQTHLDRSQLGVRTRRAVELVAARMREQRPELEAEVAADRAIHVLNKAGFKTKATRREGALEQTEYLLFLSNSQLDRLAQLALSSDGAVDARSAKDAIDQGHSIDVALFGRMVADDADLNVDAACQVAHALSTHPVATEFDYFTAVDDQNPKADTGAGMIGTVEFDSATLYRYATVNVHALAHNLLDAEAALRALEAFVRSFVTSMPTGKQNTFANRTVPDAVIVMVREDRPVNLVGAFEDAVRADGGYVKASCEALAMYAPSVDRFGSSPSASWVTRIGSRTDAVRSLGDEVEFDELLQLLTTHVRSALEQQ